MSSLDFLSILQEWFSRILLCRRRSESTKRSRILATGLIEWPKPQRIDPAFVEDFVRWLLMTLPGKRFLSRNSRLWTIGLLLCLVTATGCPRMVSLDYQPSNPLRGQGTVGIAPFRYPRVR